MSSFDVVSEVDQHELRNAVDQTAREIGNRYDFKGSNAKIELNGDCIKLTADSEFQLKQILDILYTKMAKRKLDVDCLDPGKVETSGQTAQQTITIRQGIDKELGKKIVKLVKESKLKVQTAIQGERVRISGKKRDDLQTIIARLREAKLGIPLQFTNFRD